MRAIRNDLHMDYSAVGLTTVLARMEQLATPGSILLTAATSAGRGLGPRPPSGACAC